MRLLANENFPIISVNYLKKSGFDIIAVGIDTLSITDKEVIDLAINEERTIVTFDRDYGELIFKYGFKPKAGIIYLRWIDFEPEEPGKYLKNLFETTSISFESTLTVIDKSTIRQRKYQI